MQVQLDVEAVAHQMAILQQRAHALAAMQPGDPVGGELLAALLDFGQSLPLLQLLAAPQLRDRHWASILATLSLEVWHHMASGALTSGTSTVVHDRLLTLSRLKKP